MEFVTSLKRVKRRGRQAPLPRKAVEPVRYVSGRLRRPVLERRVPAKSNQGRNDHDYNQQSSHYHGDCQKVRVGSMEIVPPTSRSGGTTARQVNRYIVKSASTLGVRGRALAFTRLC